MKALNRALLALHYGIGHWDIPPGFLCPPIPGRADHIHRVADLLAEDNGGPVPRGPEVRVLDVGVGANGVYPVVGRCEYGWSFVGADIDRVALESAARIVEANPMLAGGVELRLQSSPARVFTGVWLPENASTSRSATRPSTPRPPRPAKARSASGATSAKPPVRRRG